MRLKILHPEGPNHEPELNGAKAPTQGNLPVLETSNTELMVSSKVPSPLGTLSIMCCLPSPPETRGVAMTPKAVAKEQTKTSYLGGTPWSGTNGNEACDLEPKGTPHFDCSFKYFIPA